MQKLGKNKFVVQTLGEVLPKHRGKVTPALMDKMASVTDFSAVEIFRKCGYASCPCMRVP
jgi:hypothetical protein